MSINQYSTDIHYTFLWQQHHHHHHYHQNQNDTVDVEHHKEPLFEKPLTPSDVGKLNRLVIPKQHAEKYFPLGTSVNAGAGAGDTSSVEKGVLLCFEDDEDGKPWRFRYSYWNSSQSYVLTKGWSRYVKDKQLDAGDVVFFLRHRSDAARIFIGCRRRAAGDGRRPSSSSSSDPYLLRSDNPLQYYQSEYPHAGGVMESLQGQGMAANSKTVRLFGVNLECQLDSDCSEPSTPDGSSHGSTHLHRFFPQQGYQPPYYMDLSFSGGVNHMRNPQ